MYRARYPVISTEPERRKKFGVRTCTEPVIRLFVQSLKDERKCSVRDSECWQFKSEIIEGGFTV